MTISELSFVPTTEDDGKSITCRAENPNVTGLFLETSWKIDVVCKYFRWCVMHAAVSTLPLCIPFVIVPSCPLV